MKTKKLLKHLLRQISSLETRLAQQMSGLEARQAQQMSGLEARLARIESETTWLCVSLARESHEQPQPPAKSNVIPILPFVKRGKPS